MQGIVTGASRGLGLALTRALVERGWQLVVDARDGDALERAVGELDGVIAIAGDVADPEHRRRLVEAAGGRSTSSSTTPACSAPRRCRCSRDYDLDALRHVYEVNVLAPLALVQLALPHFADDARDRQPQLGCCRRGLRELGRLRLVQGGAGPPDGGARSARTPSLRAYAVDPGDMRTQMQQDAFPGEDISDRPPPEESVPGLLALIEGDLPSGAYRARELVGVSA